jgi:A/G-specific adenine glycosylase
LPVKLPKRKRRREALTVFILRCGSRYALEKREEKGLLAGLWQFPNAPGKLDAHKALGKVEEMGLRPSEILRVVEREHIFTHVQWDMCGVYVEVAEPEGDFFWFTGQQIREQAALPTAFRQFWEENEDG